MLSIAHLKSEARKVKSVENSGNRICLEIHDEVGTASKDAECAVTSCQVSVFAHGKGLCLQCVLRLAVFHQVVDQVAYCVDGFLMDRVDLCMQERMEEAALDRVEGLD